MKLRKYTAESVYAICAHRDCDVEVAYDTVTEAKGDGWTLSYDGNLDICPKHKHLLDQAGFVNRIYASGSD